MSTEREGVTHWEGDGHDHGSAQRCGYVRENGGVCGGKRTAAVHDKYASYDAGIDWYHPFQPAPKPPALPPRRHGDAQQQPEPMSGPSEAELRAADEALERGGELYSAGWEAGKQWERENPSPPAPPAGAAVAGEHTGCAWEAEARWYGQQVIEESRRADRAEAALSAERERIAGEIGALEDRLNEWAAAQVAAGHDVSATAIGTCAEEVAALAAALRASTAPAPAPDDGLTCHHFLPTWRMRCEKGHEYDYTPLARTGVDNYLTGSEARWCRVCESAADPVEPAPEAAPALRQAGCPHHNVECSMTEVRVRFFCHDCQRYVMPERFVSEAEDADLSALLPEAAPADAVPVSKLRALVEQLRDDSHVAADPKVAVVCAKVADKLEALCPPAGGDTEEDGDGR